MSRLTNRGRDAVSRACRFEPLEGRALMSVPPAPTPVGPEFRVNTTTALNQAGPSVASDPKGNFIVAWTNFVPVPTIAGGPDPFIGDIYAQCYNAAGVAQGGEIHVNQTTDGDQRLAAIACDDAGNFVVTWTNTDASPTFQDVYARRYNASGAPLGNEFLVNSVTASTQSDACVAMDGDGDFVIAWGSYGQEGAANQGIYARRYNAAGVAQGGEFHVNTFTTSAQRNPAAAMDPAGNFIISWEGFDQDGSGLGVFAQRYNAAGNPQGIEFRVNTTTNLSQHSPSVAADNAGNLVISWTSRDQDGSSYGIYAKRYNAAGAPQGGEFPVNTYTTSSQNVSDVTMDDDGDFIITWSSQSQDGSFYGVYAQRYNALGAPQDGEFRVNTFTSNSQAGSTAAMDADGDFVIAWSSELQDGDMLGVYAQRYAAAPVVNSSSFFFDTLPQRLQFTFSQDVSASLGTNDLVVENLTTGQTINANRFQLSYDAATNTASYQYVGTGGGTQFLPDGNYRATLSGADITSPQGIPLGADHLFNFFFLNGDANRDARVNVNDFSILAANFGQSNATFSQGDFNYDGRVNINDFTILAGRFGTILDQDGLLSSAPFSRVPISAAGNNKSARRLVDALNDALM